MTVDDITPIIKFLRVSEELKVLKESRSATFSL